ncbi:Protein of unknown function, partial [Gryllus bimaculatus]
MSGWRPPTGAWCPTERAGAADAQLLPADVPRSGSNRRLKRALQWPMESSFDVVRSERVAPGAVRASEAPRPRPAMGSLPNLHALSAAVEQSAGRQLAAPARFGLP